MRDDDNDNDDDITTSQSSLILIFRRHSAIATCEWREFDVTWRDINARPQACAPYDINDNIRCLTDSIDSVPSFRIIPFMLLVYVSRLDFLLHIKCDSFISIATIFGE